MGHIDLQLWRWTGILLLAGGVIFWIGACTPPYRQWMTHDVREYLTIIYNNQTNWYVIGGTFLVGVTITLFGMQLWRLVLTQAGQDVWPHIGFTAFAFGAVFWILNIAFRLTVTVWAAKQLGEGNELVPYFKTLMDWTNLGFAVYMVLAYFGTGCMGYALLQSDTLAPWVAWTCMAMGFGGSVLYIVRFPLFDPPLMVHTPLMIAGVMMILRSRG